MSIIRNPCNIYIKKKGIIFFLLITIFLTPFFLEFPISINSNSNSEDLQENNSNSFESPKISGTEINITTPENKTYMGPMSGYFPGTHGFENDIVGEIPSGWVTRGVASEIVEIDASKDNHNMVMEIRKIGGTESSVASRKFEQNQTEGSIEFWLYKDTDVSNDATRIVIKGDVVGSSITIIINNGDLYRDRWPDKILIANNVFSENTWHHLRCDFDVSQGFQIELDGTLYGSGYQYPLNNNPTKFIDLTISSLQSADASNYGAWFDAIGYSWDPKYNVGDNLNEGLLLSFNNNTNLEWIGYSLDGEATKTILGNTTIPMPADGPHKIQVFGNDTLGTIYQSDVRYFTVSSINMITPENKTYYEPMRGYYPATYGFENDEIGSNPSGWSVTEVSGTTVNVISGVGDHNHVVEIYDPSSSKDSVMYQTISRTSGQLEFWMRTTDILNASRVRLMDGTWTIALYLYIIDGKFQYATGSGFQEITSASSDTWYHIRIKFDCASSGDGTNDWHLWIDQVSMDGGSGYPYYGSPIEMDRIDFYTDTPYSDYYLYVDAVGYEWDPNYNIGDNLEEGLLLSFKNITNLDWKGYSLDGQANKTILGNTTIPMPAGGPHKIQVFGNDTLGTIYQSDVRDFTISSINMITPENKTYHEPMRGYYPATYGFENDSPGSLPKDWTNNSGDGCPTRIIDGLDGHKNVLELYDNSNVLRGYNHIYQVFGYQESGTIEWWWRTNNVDKLCRVFIRNESWSVSPIYICIFSNKLQYQDSVGFHDLLNPIYPNTWYRFKVDFECGGGGYKGLSADEHSIYIYGDTGTLLASVKGASLQVPHSALSQIDIRTYGDKNMVDYHNYFDAFGYSWDPKYNIRDNEKEGLLLSFENSTNLDWMGYSLDGQANKTILGNTTIRMLADGFHTILVFGNNSLGAMYQSAVRYFTIDYWNLPDLIADTLNIVDLRNQYGVYLEVKTNGTGYIEVSNQTSNFIDVDDIWSSLQTHFFYLFKLYDKNMYENNSIIEYIVIRFYYNTSDVQNPSNLYILHYIYDSINMRMVWESEDVTINTNLKYVEINITKMSYFCLAEMLLPPPPPPPDDDDGKDDEEVDFGFWLFIILLLILINMGVIATAAYVIKYKGKKEPKQKIKPVIKKKYPRKPKKRKKKKKPKMVTPKGYINCPFCYNRIRGSEQFCPYCGSPLSEKIERSELTSSIGLDKNKINLYSEDDYYEKIFLQSSNILKIWIFNAKNKTKLYEEILDPEFSDIEKKYIDITTIINADYEKNKIIEESFEFGKIIINLYIYVSKNPVILVLFSGKRFDKDYLEIIEKSIKGIDENYRDLSEDPLAMKKFLDENIFLFNSRIFGDIPISYREKIYEIFKNKDEMELVLEDLKNVTKETFLEFLMLYKKLTAELLLEKTRYMINNHNFFTGGFE